MKPSRKLALLVLVAVEASLFHPSTSYSQIPDIDGSYNGSMTVKDTCEIGPRVGYRRAINLKVKREGSSSVRLTIGDKTITAALQGPDLNWDYKHGRETGEGNFTVQSDGAVKINGTIRAPFCTGALGAAGDVVFALRGYRKVSEDFDPLASPSPSLRDVRKEFPGFSAALEKIAAYCPELISERAVCVDSEEYAKEWEGPMQSDIDALKPPPPEAILTLLVDLRTLVAIAAELGGMFISDPCTGQQVPAYPIANGLLAVFGKLFVQGITAAGRGDPAGVRAAVTQADRLLLAITLAKTVARTPCPAPSPSQ